MGFYFLFMELKGLVEKIGIKISNVLTIIKKSNCFHQFRLRSKNHSKIQIKNPTIINMEVNQPNRYFFLQPN
jgi:hypothetical protein